MSSDPDTSAMPELGPAPPNMQQEDEHMKDDIRTEFHPHSGLATEFCRFEKYRQDRMSGPSEPFSDKPWEPFKTRIDFILSALVLAAALTKEQTDTLIQLIHACVRGEGELTLQGHAEMFATWELASTKLTPVS